MIQWDQVIETLLNTFVTSAGVIAAAIISGYILLRTHHSKVKDELTITAGSEQLKRKQDVYEQVWRVLYDAFDYSQSLIDDTNWRRTRLTQTRLLLVGSLEVIDLFNKIMKVLQQESRTQDELNKQDAELTRLHKELWNAMRKDLYGAAYIPHEAMIFHQPGNLTKHALETWGKHKAVLVKEGISLLENQSEMNVDEVSRKTGIPRNDLVEIRSMAQRELLLIRELDRMR